MRTKDRMIIDGYSYTRTNSAGSGEQFFEHWKQANHGIRTPAVVRNPLVNGWRQPSPYSASALIRPALHGSFEAFNEERSASTTYWYNYYGNINGSTNENGQYYFALPDLPSDRDMPYSVRQRAINRALLRLSNRQGNILESIVEFKSSLNGLAKNARSITDFCDAFEASIHRRSAAPMRKHFGLPRSHPKLREWQRKLNGASAAARSFGSAWLTFWFGLAPVVDDMVLIMRILGDAHIFDRPLSGKARAFERSTVSSESNLLSGSNAGFDGGFKRNVSVNRELGYFVSLHVTLDENFVRRKLSEATALGATDVATTVWAVMPYSWLIDFVVPVSQYLRGWEGRHGLNFKGGTITRYQAYTKPKVTLVPNGKAKLLSKPEPYITAERTFARTVLKSLPGPQMYAQAPKDLWKAVTVFSLLATKLSFLSGRTGP